MISCWARDLSRVRRDFFTSILPIAVLSGLLFGGSAQAQTCNSNSSAVSSLCIAISNTSPSPGSSVTVTANYCSQVNGGSGTEFDVFLNSNATTIQACPTSGQIFLVDAAGVNRNDTDPCAAAGQGTGCDIGWYDGLLNPGATCTNRSVTWVLTIPSNVAVGGTYNLVVAAGGYTNLRCGSAPLNSVSIPLSIPLPPPGASVLKSVEESGTTVNPGDLLLFRMDYSFVNTHNFTITDSVPANTTLVAAGPAPTSGAVSGSGPGSPITWTLGDATVQSKGQVWMLVRVNSGASAPVSGTAIPNTASYSSAEVALQSTNSVSVTVGPGFTLVKSQSAALITPGQNITYTLSYTHGGQSLQFFDSYDNDAVNTSGNSIVGYDGTGYTMSNAGATFGIATDPQNNHYIVSNACPSNAQGVTCTNFTGLLRNSPPVTLCGGYTVEGSMQIPVGDHQGADAHMILADNTAPGGVGDAYMIGMSLDAFPGNFFLQKNDSSTATVSNPVTLTNAQIATTITAGVWYTVKAQVTYIGPGLQICGRIWPSSSSEPTTWDFCYTDPTPLPCTPRAGNTKWDGRPMAPPISTITRTCGSLGPTRPSIPRSGTRSRRGSLMVGTIPRTREGARSISPGGRC